MAKENKYYLIHLLGGYQYAEGITGIERFESWYGTNGSLGYTDFNDYSRKLKVDPETVCFKTKKEAKAYCRERGIKSYEKKGAKNYGYGSVGAKWRVVKIVELGKEFHLQ